MNTRTDNEHTTPASIAEEAGMWDARLRAPDCTSEDRARFAAWRDADPAHREAFERLQMFVATLRQEQGRADVRALRDEALRAVRHRQRRFWVGAIAASVTACAIGAALWVSPAREWLREPTDLAARDSSVESYSTGTGQRSTLVLEDGSSVELNARSRINVSFSASERRVELLEGQALFSVAKNKHRPFVVNAGSRHIVALGTQFDVRLDRRSLQVTLIEGKVRVGSNVSDPSSANDEEIELVPGNQLLAVLPASTQETSQTAAMTQARTLVRDIDVTKVMGWRDGRIFLNDISLEAAVEEMNRHSVVQIRIEDAALANPRVNGMFKAGGQDSFVAALQEYFPIAARRQSDQEILLTSR